MHTPWGTRSKAGLNKCSAGFWASSVVPCGLHAAFAWAAASRQGPWLSSLLDAAVGSSVGCAPVRFHCSVSAGG